MSNLKVEKYKKEKYNRKKIQKRDKMLKRAGILLSVILAASVAGLIGYQIYDDNREKFIDDIDSQKLYESVYNVITANTEESGNAEEKTDAETTETETEDNK